MTDGPDATEQSNTPAEPQPPTPPLSPPTPHGARTPPWLWALALILVGTVAILQRPMPGPSGVTPEQQAAAVGDVIGPVHPGQLVLVGKVAALLRESSPAGAGSNGELLLENLDSMIGAESPPQGQARPPDAAPPSATDRFRVAIIAAELAGPQEAVKRLKSLQADLSPTSPLREDVEAALRVYHYGAAAKPDAKTPIVDVLPTETRDRLIDRHGLFARLFLSYDNPGSDPVRQRASTQALALVIFMIAFLTVFGLAFVGGLVLLVVGFVLAASGRLRPGFVPLRTGADGYLGSRVWLETFVLFVAGFLGLKLTATLVAMALPGSEGPVWFAVIGQWMLALFVLWPVARGMPWRRFRHEIGWHAGRGVFREVGAGILGYIAAIPIYVAVALVVVFVYLTTRYLLGGGTDRMPENRVFEMIENHGPLLRLAIVVLAVCWAPLVEEAIFRGALYRHVRSRFAVPVAAVVTASMFALMHSAMLMQLVLIGTLGVVFALMREWRSSLIPSMTAHFIHNGSVLTLVMVVLWAMRP